MKITNFIHPAPAQQERATKLWWLVSLMLGFVTIALISYIQISQLMTWASYRQEYKKYSNLTKQYAQITEEKKKIAEQEAMLKNKIHIISSANDQCCKLIGQLNSLNKACTKDINLSSCTLAPDGATITLNCPTIEHAQACSKAMAQSRQFTDLKITSICPTKQSITITLKTAIQGK